MSALKIQVKKDKKGEWRWKLLGGNNRITANSAGDGFKTKYGVIRSVQTAKRLMADAKIVFVEKKKRTKS